MYSPAHLAECRLEVMHGLMKSHPLAALVTLTSEGIDANHIPMHLSEHIQPYGVLQGHVARANPVWNAFKPEFEALAIFQGPDAYISPAWYAAKKETGKVVPTWNYITVHAYGTLQIHDDPIWLRSELEHLVNDHESDFEEPWQISDAPEEYIQKMMEAIVGIEIVITRLVGKWKISQNQSASDQQRVGIALKHVGSSKSNAMADLIPQIELFPG